MDFFRPSQSVGSADRDITSGSGSPSVLSRDPITKYLWKKISLDQSKVSLTGDLRYMTPLWVSGNEEPQEELILSISSQSNIINQKITEKIRAALKLLAFRELHVLVQFWSPRVVGKHQLLTTADQPFGLGVPSDELCFYRRDSERMAFLVDKDDEVEDISAPARVFRRGLPEWTSDIVTNYLPKHFPQKECAVRCNLHGYLAIPVFDSTTSLCVGVLELLMSSKNTDYSFEVQQVHNVLKTQNLTSPKVFDSATPNVPNDPKKNELDEICGILKTMCDIHSLPLAQTWAVSPISSFVSHDTIIDKSCSSFNTKCIGKVCMSTTDLPFHVRDLGMWPFREVCKEQHLDKSFSVVGKALLDHGSSFCQDVTQLSEEEYPLVHYASSYKLTSFVAIFLHSDKGNNDYILEFFLPLYSIHVLDLIQTLKQQLEVAPGFELGKISPLKFIGPPKDASYLSSSIKPHTIQTSSTTMANTLAFGIDSSDSESFLPNAVKDTYANVRRQWSLKENYPTKQADIIIDTEKVACNEMSDNINVVGLTKNDNATSSPIVIEQKASDTITSSVEKSNRLKRGRKRKIDTITMKAVEQHVGQPIGQAAESFGVSRSTLKRFCRENGMSSWPLPKQSKKNSNIQSNSICQAAQLLMVKATFKNDIIKFRVPTSSGVLVELENQVAQRLDLKGKKLSMKYKGKDNDLQLITCDNDLHTLPEFSSSNTTMRLLVELACD